MKNTELVEKIRSEQSLPENILQWAEYLIYMLSARNCKGFVTTLSSYMNSRSFMPEVLDATSFDAKPARLEIEDAIALKELLFEYGVTTRTYNVEYRGELYPVEDEEDIQLYLGAVKRVNDATGKFEAGELSKEDFDAVVADNDNQAVNPITGNYMPLSCFTTVDYFTDLVEADVRFAAVKDSHIAKAMYKLLTPEQISNIEAHAKEIAAQEMVAERQ